MHYCILNATMEQVSNLIILRKRVDKSLLYSGQGITIATKFVPLLDAALGRHILPGENIPIQLLIGSDFYEANLKSSNNIEILEGRHSEVIQIRFKSNAIIERLRTEFPASFQYIDSIWKNRKEKSKSPVKTPDSINEYIVLSSTSSLNVFALDCFSDAANKEVDQELAQLHCNEYDLENLIDPNATVTIRPALLKVRKMNSKIASTLKELYDYRCQITGERIGSDYGGCVVEAHHIEYFSTSHNNELSNVIIISPNFHRIIHKTNPTFDRKNLEFVFPNGVHQKLMLTEHLKK